MWLAGAIRKNIPPGANDPQIIPVGNVFHVRAGYGDSLYDVFQNRGGIESHGYVRFTGVIEQYRDTTYEADAQSAGNSWVDGGVRHGLLSWETEGVCGELWTPKQIAALKYIIAATKAVHPIPLRVCPTPTSGGMGYHAMFREWNPNNHSCPCKERIVQFHDVIVPYITQLSHPAVTPERKISQMLNYATEDGRQWCTGGDKSSSGKTMLYYLPGGPAATGDGVAADYTSHGVPTITISYKTLRARGFAFDHKE